jgi:hypothetical protein
MGYGWSLTMEFLKHNEDLMWSVILDANNLPSSTSVKAEDEWMGAGSSAWSRGSNIYTHLREVFLHGRARGIHANAP